MRIVTYHGRPVARIHQLSNARLRLKLYERSADGRPRYLRISQDEWAHGRRDEYFDGSLSRSQVCRGLAADYVRRERPE